MGKTQVSTPARNAENREQLSRDEHRYRGLFENMVEGFFLAEVICDASGEPVDYRYLDVNPAFEALTGLSAEQAIGNTARELLPGIEPEWIKLYGQVALTGRPARMTAYAGPLGRYYETTAYCPKPGQFACLFIDASDRKQSEDALRASEQEARARAAELSAILNAVPAITFIARDAECREMTSSRAAYDVLGLPNGANTSKSALLERPSTFRAMKDGREIAAENLPVQLAARTGREIRNFQFELALQDGTSRQLFGHAVPLFSETGEPRGSVGAFLDVTEQNRVVEALRESEERFRTLADNISQFAWMADSSGNVFWYNQRWYDYTGTTFEEMKGPGWQKVHHPDHLGRVIEKFKRYVANGEPWEDTFPLRGKDGNYRWFLSRALPIRDERGEVVRWFGTNTDITEQRATEQALRTSEQLLRFHMENTPLAVVEWDADFRLSRWSSEAERMFGWRAEEVLGKRFDEFRWIYEEDVAKVQEVSDGLVHGSRPRSVSSNRNYRKDGSVIHCEWYNSSLVDEAGRLVSIFSLVLNVTERQQAQTALVRSEKLASLGRMAATVAHEINNPLAAVMNLLYLARTDRACAPAIVDQLNTAESELKRVSHITRQVLGFYRESVAPTSVSLAAIADESLELFKQRWKAKQVDIEKRYKGEVIVRAVAGELRQVLSNLVANSLDALPDGGKICLRISRRDVFVKLVFADNGLGIEPDAQARIFEPLFTTKESVGTGLGLWISKQLIEKNGGFIRFRSSTGKHRGTTFLITLPAETHTGG